MSELVAEQWVQNYKRYPIDKEESLRWIFSKFPWQSAVTWIKKLKKNLNDSSYARVLEAGCGTGKISIKLARETGCRVFLLDYSQDALKSAREILQELQKRDRKEYRAYFIQGDIKHLPFLDYTFELVFNEGVIEHWRDDFERWSVIKEMARVTKRNGKVLTWVPNKKCIFRKFWRATKWPGYFRGVKEYPLTPLELKEALEKSNLNDTTVEAVDPQKSFFIWPAFLKIFKPIEAILLVVRIILPNFILRSVDFRLSREILGVGTKI